MSVDNKFHLALREERRRYTCEVCGRAREIVVRRIDKSVLVCVHEDTRGEMMPILQLREEGILLPEVN